MTRLAGVLAAIAGVAWVALFGADAFELRTPEMGGLLWAFPLAFGAGAVALYQGGASAGLVDRVGSTLGGVLAVASGLAYLGVLVSADDAQAYIGWLAYVLGIVLLFGLVLLYGVVHVRRPEDRDAAAVTALVASGPPFAFLAMILGYKLATGWWVTDPSLISIGQLGSAILIGGGWLALGIAIALRKDRQQATLETRLAP